jgi:hypothetical protein
MTDFMTIDAFLQSSPHPAWLATSGSECLYINPALERLTGLKSDEINQVDWRSFILEEDRAAASASWQRSLESGTAYRTTVRLRRFDGIPAAVELVAFGHRLNDGTALWLFTCLDVHAPSLEYPRPETQLQATLNLVPAYTWYTLPSGALTFVNKRTGDYLGLANDHPLRLGIDTGGDSEVHIPLLHPDDRDEARRIWSDCIRTGVPSESSIRIRNAEGEYRWFQTQVEPLRASNGAILFWIGVNLDIHERKQAEDRARRNEQELRTLIDVMPALIGTALPDGQCDFMGQSWLDYTGQTREEVLGWGWANVIHPDDRESVEISWKRGLASGKHVEQELRARAADGTYRWFLNRDIPLLDENGSVVKWYGILFDIQTLKETQRALQAREQELVGIIETIPSLLWSASPTGEVTHISRRVVEYTGVSLDDFLNLGWKRIIHPEDFEDTAKAFFQAIQTGESYRATHRLRSRDGEYRWHYASGEPLRDSNGKIIQWYGLSIDIDERKRAEDHLRDTRIKLAKASRLATVAELSASIAHELNQPLMSILVNAQAAKRWLGGVPSNVSEASPSIERIIRDAHAADETMQHIRALFKQESFDKIKVNIPEVLHEVVRVVQEDPKKKRVPIDFHFDEYLPAVHADKTQIQQVFINLIVNAFEALEEQQVAPLVKLRVTTDQNEMLVQVIDNGAGVDDPERIFDAFVTTKEKGMGIGLAVSRTIVEAHGGRLWAENNTAGGATFNVALPSGRADSVTA